jgi:hypothetical protein
MRPSHIINPWLEVHEQGRHAGHLMCITLCDSSESALPPVLDLMLDKIVQRSFRSLGSLVSLKSRTIQFVDPWHFLVSLSFHFEITQPFWVILIQLSDVFRLDNLTASLSNDEIRQLCTRFNAIQFHTDIFFKVPIEVALLIAEYLSFEDLMTARDVSLAWRHRCSSSDFELKIIKLHFRTQWQQTDLEDTIAKQSLLDWFPKAAMKRVRKLSGGYISMSAYHYHRDGFLPRRLDEVDHQYNSGRIAYLFGNSIVVQNLNRGHLAQPKVYVERNRIGMRAGEWLLSNDLLVAHQ